jgi:hypothetical protein
MARRKDHHPQKRRQHYPEKLTGESGAHVGLKQGKDGKDLFTRWKLHGEYLDIARP